MLRTLAVAAVTIGLWSIESASARAAFHLWKIQEVYSNASGSVQFVELISPNPSSGEHQVGGHLVRSNARMFSLPNNLGSSATSGRTFLVATPGFAALPGGITPDFTFPSANFFSTVADTLRFDSVDTFTFTAGQLPTNGVLSRVDSNPFGPDATNDFVNVLNSPKNFAGAMGTLFIPGDTNDDGLVNRLDAARLAANFGRLTGATRAQGDFDRDFDVDLADWAMLQSHLTPGVPVAASISSASIPEPASLGLLGVLFSLAVAGAIRRRYRHKRPRVL